MIGGLERCKNVRPLAIPNIILWKIANSMSVSESLMSFERLEGRSSITIQQLGGVMQAPRPDEVRPEPKIGKAREYVH
jgi:hypothetical protein